MRLLAALLFTVLSATIAIGEPRKCIDTLAGAKYPGVLRSIPNDFCIGLFAKTFGDAFPTAKAELDAGRSCLRVNLLWSDSHSFGDRDLKFIASESRRYNILCQAFPEAHIEIAPLTEHNLKNPDKFLSVVQANAPNCKGPVNTPWKGALSRNFKREVHGSHSKPNPPYNYSYDGTNSVDSDFVAMLQKHASADMFCAWHPRLNLKWSMKDTTPRPERRAKPTADFMASLVYLFTDKGQVSLPRGWLVKSHAEKHGPEDPKGDKLLIISPARVYRKGKVLPIVLKRDGKKLGQLDYYGAFEGGGYRFYAPAMGWKYGANVEVWIGKRKYGVINPGFRVGSYRE